AGVGRVDGEVGVGYRGVRRAHRQEILEPEVSGDVRVRESGGAMEQTSSVAPGGPGILGVGPGTLRQSPEGVEGARRPLESNRGSIGRSVHEEVNAWGNGLKRYVHHGIGHRKFGQERVAGT